MTLLEAGLVDSVEGLRLWELRDIYERGTGTVDCGMCGRWQGRLESKWEDG